MNAQLVKIYDEEGYLVNYHLLIDGKECALLADMMSEMTIIPILLRGASREPTEGMLTAGMPRDMEWIDLTHIYNDFRIGHETRSLEDPDVCCELVRDVLAQGYTMDEIMHGIERLGIERIKNPRLLYEQQPEWQEQELFQLE